MTYSEQLQKEEWKTKRLEILERDGHKCTQCECDKYLHVHHLYYDRNKFAWEYDNKDLVTLCNDCHTHTHRTTKIKIIPKKRKSPKEKLTVEQVMTVLKELPSPFEFDALYTAVEHGWTRTNFCNIRVEIIKKGLVKKVSRKRLYYIPEGNTLMFNKLHKQ